MSFVSCFDTQKGVLVEVLHVVLFNCVLRPSCKHDVLHKYNMWKVDEFSVQEKRLENE